MPGPTPSRTRPARRRRRRSRLRERIAAARRADAPQPLGVGLDAPLDRVESQLKQAQADRAAADGRRAELERQLAYQQNRPAAIRQRLTAAREEQEAIAAALLAKRLPALLNMILAQRSQFTSGSRDTIATLTSYAVVAIRTLLALNAIGAQWSQLQWLVAALGVGIGFGLQQIVANFISGLIILFERPIRVGDVVTVGNTDGVVTRIRIRTTTIRNWDRKELLVPNKEFITGRLLNWSLSDQVTPIMVTVGVAYGTDVEQAHALMREATQQHELVLKDPAPILSFGGFGDNSLTLILRTFIDDLDRRVATITDLHKAIDQ